MVDEPRGDAAGRDPDLDAAFDDIVSRWADEPVEPIRPKGPADTGPSTDSTGDVAPPAASAVNPPITPRRAPQAEPATTEAAPDEPPPTPSAGGVRIPSGQVVPQVPREGSAQEHFGFRGYTVPDEPDEDFVPPPPAPMPDAESDPTFWAIVGCLLAGPLTMILLAVTGRTSMTWLMGAAVVATIVGFVLLVMRGGGTPRDPDDDGARV